MHRSFNSTAVRRFRLTVVVKAMPLMSLTERVSSLRSKATFLRFFAGLLFALSLGPQAYAAGNPANGQTIFNTTNYCTTCHTPQDRAAAGHANAPSDIATGIAGDYGGTYTPGGTTGMGRFSAGGAYPLSSTDLDDLGAYIGWFVIPTTANTSATVAYNSGANTIDLTSSIATGAGTGTPKNISIGAASHGTSSNATISAASGSVVTTVSYTPTSGYYGADSFTYTVSNDAGTATTRTISITVSPPPAPVITSAFTASGNAGQAFNYQITASNSPTSFGASGLPTGLSVDSTTGVISGTPTVAGTFGATITATNVTGTGSHGLTITVSTVAPSITSAGTTSGTGGLPFSYQITAANLPSSFSASGLPAGVSVDTSTGLISGTPTVTGTFNATIGASNSAGSDSKPLTITLASVAPVITSASTTNGTSGQAFSFQVTASGLPTSFAATGLPSGLTINTSTGLISGTPAGGGVANVTITVTNSSGNDSHSLTINVAYVPPGAGTLTTDVAFNTPTQIVLPVTGQFTQVIIVTQPTHGTVQAPAPGVATVLYTPVTGYSNGQDSFTYKATGQGGAGDSQTKQVTIRVGTLAPSAYGVSMHVTLNTPATLDFAPYIGGSGISGVSVPAQPAHGAVTVNGTKVTYAPASDYFGDDTFSYVAYGNAGTSAPAKVSVSVTGRPDPSKDATVLALINAQIDAAKRFSKAQISNFATRMEYLHRPRGSASSQNGGAFAATSGQRGSGLTSSALGPQYNGNSSSSLYAGTPQAGAAYHPGASLAADPAGRSTASGNMGGGTDASGALAAAVGAASGDKSNSAGLAAVGQGLGFVDASLKGRSLDLSALNAAQGGGASDADNQTNVWVGGTLQFGDRNKGAVNVSTFTSDGISVGADRRVTKNLVLGVGVGAARDNTDIGSQGSESRARSTSFAAYGSYQASANTFIDTLLGYGSLHYDTERFVAPIDAFADGKRDGHFYFGSTTAAYEYLGKNFLLSPYGRLDLSTHQLDQVSETGAGSYALTYGKENIPSTRFSLGLRTETAHETNSGWMKPRFRIEFQHEFQGQPGAALYYADEINGPRYSTSSTDTERDSMVLGLGGDYIMRNGFSLGLDYQMERRLGQPDIQAINLKLMYSLDGKNSIPAIFDANLADKGFGLQADAGYMYDDNVSRASSPAQKAGDSSVSSTLGKSLFEPLGAHTRFGMNALVGGEKFYNYDGLSRVFALAQGELQYRSSGDFSSPIFALQGSLTEEQYRSALRDGYRYSYGVSMLEPLSDRLSVKGILSRNVRQGRSEVYQDKDYSGRLNVDYDLSSGQSLYLSGEYRKGDVVGLGTHTLANVDMAEVFTPDDVFVAQDLYSYRFDGKTTIVTLGYVVPLGQKDSLDMSLRRAVSRASSPPSFAIWDRYESNQFSVVYLFSF